MPGVYPGSIREIAREDSATISEGGVTLSFPASRKSLPFL
jgi:hypothetical protein